jgi:hypothetical protein
VDEKTTYCNHREVLASEKLNPILPETHTGAIKAVNINQKNRPLNARLFRQLHAAVDSEPTAVLCVVELWTRSVTTLLSRFADGYLTDIL